MALPKAAESAMSNQAHNMKELLRPNNTGKLLRLRWYCRLKSGYDIIKMRMTHSVSEHARHISRQSLQNYVSLAQLNTVQHQGWDLKENRCHLLESEAFCPYLHPISWDYSAGLWVNEDGSTAAIKGSIEHIWNHKKYE